METTKMPTHTSNTATDRVSSGGQLPQELPQHLNQESDARERADRLVSIFRTGNNQHDAISDILDRMDADDAAYRELRRAVTLLQADARDHHARLAALEADRPIASATTDRSQVVGMRDDWGDEYPRGGIAWRFLEGRGLDPESPKAWDLKWPSNAPHAPIYAPAALRSNPEEVTDDR